MRGIEIGSSWKEVIDAYGHGRGNLYVESNDEIFTYLKKQGITDSKTGQPLHTILSEQSDEFIQYSSEDSNQIIRFYFKNGLVTWIFYYTSN